jgi:large subunit ribosomal protein L25
VYKRQVQGETKKVLLQEVQHHPVTGRILHADFQEISMTEKLRVEIPVRLSGEPAGVTQQGGVLEHILRAIEVECLPGDIVEQFDVDVSALQIGDRLSVSDIKVDAARLRC